MSLSVAEQLAYSTIRIECINSKGQTGTGTGFLFRFLEQGENHVPVIVTNKHVVRDAVKGKIILTKSDINGNPLDTDHFTVSFDNFESLWRLHPDSNVDLCAMPFAPVVNAATGKSARLFYRTFNKNLLPTQQQKDDFDLMEEIVMIGYPNGIWDQTNNRPIFRRGHTATHPNFNYNGKQEFMIDAACFPGSSGSPVLIFNPTGYTTKSGNVYMGATRVILLGVLYAGPQHTATGDIIVTTVPTLQTPMAISRIPDNLGIVIRSERIVELEKLFEK